MAVDVVDLREFYTSKLGLCVRRLLRAHLAKIWPNLDGETLLALGFGTPLLRPWREGARRIISVMPAEQGALYWPKEGPNVTIMADPAMLPIEDEGVDRVLALHALEGVPDPDALLREAWRVLRGNGRLLVIVPNRRGLWALSDGTPFGSGRPYSGSQLRAALRAQGFTVRRCVRALAFPPIHAGWMTKIAPSLERYLGVFCPYFSGLLLMEAEKQIYAPLLAQQKTRKRLVLPMPMPASPGALPT